MSEGEAGGGGLDCTLTTQGEEVGGGGLGEGEKLGGEYCLKVRREEGGLDCTLTTQGEEGGGGAACYLMNIV